MRTHVANRRGARARLGEVALVDGHSAVGNTGLVFYDTLFDEETPRHISPWARRSCKPCRGHMTSRPNSGSERGGQSVVDPYGTFMIGSNELEVDGV